MKVEYYKEYSFSLARDMEFKVFGRGGKPVLVQGSIAETDFEKVRAFFETL